MSKILTKDKNKKVPYKLLRKSVVGALLGVSLLSASAGLLVGCSEDDKGKDGATWTSGTATPTAAANPAKVGDFYFDEDDFNIYKFTDDGWVLISNIKGEKGDKGDTGETGEKPTISITDGFWVINGEKTNIKAQGEAGTTPTISISEGGFWVINGAESSTRAKGEKGDKGDNGSKWTIGEGAPTAVAETGDMYLDKNTFTIWQMGEVMWEEVGSVKGADGQDGKDAKDPTIAINEDGFWVINGYVTDVNAHGATYGDILISERLTEAAFAGKEIVVFGDAIALGLGASDTAHGWAGLLASRLGATITNKSSSGVTITTNVVDKNGNLKTSILDRITSFSDQADIIIVALGTNDWDLAINGDGVQLGTLGSEDTDTIYGAFNVCARALAERYAGTNTKIYFSTPIISNSTIAESTKSNWSSTTDNALGYSLRDICKAISETGAMYDIPTLDMNLLSGIYYNSAEDNNISGLNDAMNDTLHPNDVGYGLMADAWAEFVLANYSYVDAQNVRTLTLEDSGTTEVVKVRAESTYTLQTPTKEDYTFIHWVDEETGNTYVGGTELEIYSNLKLTAVYNLTRLPMVTFVDLAGGSSNYTTVSLDEDQAVLDVSPDFVSTNSLGLVASYYTDQACTQVFSLETDTITEDTTVYVYWETDPRWFVVEDGVITGTTTAVVDFDKSQIEKLILPRCDANGTAITTFGPDDQTTSPFYGTFASSFTALTEIVIPEGYTTIGKYVMAVEKETAISDQQSTFVVRIPSTIETVGTMAFTNVKVGEYIVSEENANFASKDGCLVDKAQTMLFRYPSGKTATAVDLTGFTGIDAGAFYANTTITEMKIPALTTKTNAAFDGLVNLSVVHFDFTITDSVMFSRKLFSSYLGKSNYSLWKETSTIYVNSEADKVALTNILIYGKTQPVLEDDGSGSMDEPISDGTFCDDGYRDSLISNIEVISAE